MATKLPLTKKSKRRYAAVAALVSAIGVAHFVLQMTFIQEETPRAVETAAQLPPPSLPAPPSGVSSPPPLLAEPKKIVADEIPQIVQPAAYRRRETAVPNSAAPPVNRKKAARESKSERLRRAERILTGV